MEDGLAACGYTQVQVLLSTRGTHSTARASKSSTYTLSQHARRGRSLHLHGVMRHLLPVRGRETVTLSLQDQDGWRDAIIGYRLR